MEKETQEKALKLFWKYYNDPKNTIKYEGSSWLNIIDNNGEEISTMYEDSDYFKLKFKGFHTIAIKLKGDIKDLFFEYKKKFDEDRFSSMLEFFNKELDNEVKV